MEHSKSSSDWDNPLEAIAVVIQVAQALESGWGKDQLIHRDIVLDPLTGAVRMRSP